MRIVTFALLALSVCSFGQRVKQPDIQFVSLADTFLVSQLSDVIKVANERYPLFRQGKGYLGLGLNYVKKVGSSPDNHPIDTVLSFIIDTSHMALDGTENTLGDQYPPYYSVVNGRIVLIYDNGLAGAFFGYSSKSKKKLRNKIEPFLEKVGPSRTLVNLDWQRKIFYMRDLTTGEMLPPRVIDVHH